jgi:hypothetical protein
LETIALSVRDLTHRSLPTDDLSKILGPSGVKVLLELMRDAYFDLHQLKKVTLSMDENDITEEWFVWLQLRWRESNISLIPIPEKPDKSKAKPGKMPPRVDFCFRSRWDDRSYFGAECKLIEANNSTLCSRYIKNGVKRYIDGRYGQKCSEGAMVGYIRQTKCADVVREIRFHLNKMEGVPCLDKTDLLLPFEEHYVSKHKRVEGWSPFIIHHLLFLFEQQT